MYRNAIIEDINIKVCDMKFDITWSIKILLLNTVDSKLPTKIIGTDKRKHAGDTKSVYKFLIYLLNTIMLKIPTIHDETNKFDSSVFDSIKILPFKIRNVCPSNAKISKILDIFEEFRLPLMEYKILVINDNRNSEEIINIINQKLPRNNF